MKRKTKKIEAVKCWAWKSDPSVLYALDVRPTHAFHSFVAVRAGDWLRIAAHLKKHPLPKKGGSDTSA